MRLWETFKSPTITRLNRRHPKLAVVYKGPEMTAAGKAFLGSSFSHEEREQRRTLLILFERHTRRVSRQKR